MNKIYIYIYELLIENYEEYENCFNLDLLIIMHHHYITKSSECDLFLKGDTLTPTYLVSKTHLAKFPTQPRSAHQRTWPTSVASHVGPWQANKHKKIIIIISRKFMYLKPWCRPNRRLIFTK